MRFLLDEERLNGTHEVSLNLRPLRVARPVDSSSFSSLIAEIQRLCQTFGGPGHPLLPVENGKVQADYSGLLQTECLDGVSNSTFRELKLPPKVDLIHPWDYPVLPILARYKKEEYSPFVTTELDDSDPWAGIYAAVLGSVPAAPSPELFEHMFESKDLSFDDFVPLKRGQGEGSLNHLLSQLLARETRTVRQMGLMFLAAGIEPYTGLISRSAVPDPSFIRRSAGPNIIVGCTPNSVEDIALLWNLRAAHGDSRILPIGIPIDEINPDSVRKVSKWTQKFGWNGGTPYLVSASVPGGELLSRLGTRPEAEVVPYQDVLTFGPAASRPRAGVAVWNEGVARIEAKSDSDKDVLRETGSFSRRPRLNLDVRVRNHHLPSDATMRGEHRFGLSYLAGAASLGVSDRGQSGTVEVHWPSGWTSLTAAAKTRNLRIEPSRPGAAALALIKAVGSIQELRFLAHPELVALLYDLAEMTGMSWMKKRWKRLEAELRAEGSSSETLRQIAHTLSLDASIIAPQGETKARSYNEFQRALGTRDAATKWIRWAEKRRLVVRGASTECRECGTQTWVPLAALRPPIICPGCGREVEDAFRADHLPFTYRVGEVLRRVLEVDALGHVLALRYLASLFSEGGLVGIHPGVNFYREGQSQVLGEADLVLLFADGSLVVGEVKRTESGGDSKAAELLETLAEACDSPWSFFAVTQDASATSSLRKLERREDSRPRFILTNDHLFEPLPMLSFSQDLFEWTEASAEDLSQRRADFQTSLNYAEGTDGDEFLFSGFGL